MKKNLLIAALLPLAAMAQVKPVAGIYGGLSPKYKAIYGAEAGATGLVNNRISLLAFAHYSTVTPDVGLSYGGKAFLKKQLAGKNDYAGLIVGAINQVEPKGSRATLPLFGFRFQTGLVAFEFTGNQKFFGMQAGVVIGGTKK